MVGHEHVRRCVGKWVICHTTTRGDIRGILHNCSGTHLFMRTTTYQAIAAESDEDSQFIHSCGPESDSASHVFYGGWGSVAVPLAAIAGITLIGLSASWW